VRLAFSAAPANLRERDCCLAERARAGTRAPEKSRTSIRRFTGPLHYRCATGADRAGDRSRTGLGLCGAQTCHQDTPAWWCRTAPVVSSQRRQQLSVRDSCVGPVGFEPTFCLGKNQVQSRFCYRPSSPTLWNRTRTSRASAERADQLRKSGIRVLHACFAGARAAPDHHRHHLRLSEITWPVGAYKGRTSGLDAVAVTASAPLAIRDLHSDIESQIASCIEARNV
jgi:hypothetical protein